MKKITSFLLIVFLLAIFVATPVSAATSAGIKPNSFLYFFDTTFEKVNLFFTFNPEKKAKIALEYADERLAEVETLTGDKDSDTVKSVMENYKANIVLATEKSKEVKDQQASENLFNTISDNASKNQEVLAGVLDKVPEEARDAILKAIEASRKSQEDATRQIVELKSEVEQLKQEVADLKTKDEEQEKVIEEVSRQKSESTQITVTQTPTIATPPITTSQNQTQPIKISISIDLKNIGETTAKIEWSTSESTESKLYLTGENINSEQYLSKSGFSTRHMVELSNLKPVTDYSYQITAVGDSGFTNYTDTFKTKTPSPTLQITPSSNISLGSTGIKISWDTTYVSSCIASGDWSGEKNASDEYSLSFSQIGNYTYNLTCTGDNGESISKSISMNVIDTKPKITFYFNGSPSNTYTGYVGDSVKMAWEFSYATRCAASGDWDGDKYTGNSQTITLDSAGTFNYTLDCISTYTAEKSSATASIITIAP